MTQLADVGDHASAPGAAAVPDIESLPIDALGLLPSIPWDQGPARDLAARRGRRRRTADAFIAGPITGYSEGREYPAEPGTSALSPHLHWGEIGPRQIVHAIVRRPQPTTPTRRTTSANSAGASSAIRCCITSRTRRSSRWTPSSPTSPGAMTPTALLRAWQRGRTGIPIVDAGMRELWHTGWMHNRVRMIVSSLLTKNLRLPWQQGARWFWDTLVDADLASNTQGWQWSAGSGADAAPYFRIFNPVRRANASTRRHYVRRWCPELARCRTSSSISPGRPSRRCWSRSACGSAATTRHRWWT
jgi:deoxyribodipyrimidine photo-lyase